MSSLMERAAGQSHHLKEVSIHRQIMPCHGQGERRGCQHQPRGTNGEQRLQGFTLAVFPSNTIQSASTGAEERQRLVIGA